MTMRIPPWRNGLRTMPKSSAPRRATPWKHCWFTIASRGPGSRVFAKNLGTAKGEVRGCKKTCQLSPLAKPAAKEDYEKEFLDLPLAVKVVKNLDEALDNIPRYGPRHTEAIVTNNYQKAMRFLREV